MSRKCDSKKGFGQAPSPLLESHSITTGSLFPFAYRLATKSNCSYNYVMSFLEQFSNQLSNNKVWNNLGWSQPKQRDGGADQPPVPSRNVVPKPMEQPAVIRVPVNIKSGGTYYSQEHAAKGGFGSGNYREHRPSRIPSERDYEPEYDTSKVTITYSEHVIEVNEPKSCACRWKLLCGLVISCIGLGGWPWSWPDSQYWVIGN